MVLPVVTLSLGLIGLYSRYVRSAMLTSLREPFSTVARGKGLRERVVARHALRLSLIPLVAVVTLDLGAVVGASLAADYIFNMGGFASLLVLALGNADPFELTAILVVLSVLVVTFMTLGDAVVHQLDPRLR